MKTTHRTLLYGLLISLPWSACAQSNLKQEPAYLRTDEVFDLQIAKPEVNVNLPRFLLMNAVSEFDGGEGDPFAAAGINLAEILSRFEAFVRLWTLCAGRYCSELVGMILCHIQRTYS